MWTCVSNVNVSTSRIKNGDPTISVSDEVPRFYASASKGDAV